MDNADCEKLQQARVTCEGFQSIKDLGGAFRHERPHLYVDIVSRMQSLRRNLPSFLDPTFGTFGQELEVL